MTPKRVRAWAAVDEKGRLMKRDTILGGVTSFYVFPSEKSAKWHLPVDDVRRVTILVPARGKRK